MPWLRKRHAGGIAGQNAACLADVAEIQNRQEMPASPLVPLPYFGDQVSHRAVARRRRG